MTKAFVTLILLLPGGLQMSGQPTVEQVVPVAPDFIVAADGSGDFRTIGEAFDAVPDFRKNRTTILVRRGIYREKLVLATSKTNITLLGENRNETVVTWNDFAQKKNRFGEEMGTTGSSTFFVFGEGFRAENITFENSAGPVGQAVFIGCHLGNLVKPEGWHNWDKPEAEKTAFFAEYGNTGPGATGERVPWMHLLSREEAAEYTPQKILGDWIESE